MAAFIDTNVLVYCTDTGAPAKRRAAQTLVERLSLAGEVVISTQVLIGLFHVLTRKQRLPPARARELVNACMQWTVVPADATLVAEAMALGIRHQLSIGDAMVVQAALRAQTDVVYSEDLGQGRQFGSLKVVNPFVAS